jgi:tRNA pseudouridine55 synthase
MYRLARRGQAVERQPVAVRVHTLELLEFLPPFVRLRTVCSKGTYARSLCDDIGRALGCGGHLHALTRTRSGRFSMDGVITLPELEAYAAQGRLAEALIPVNEALSHLPAVRVTPEAGRLVLHGGGIPAALVAQCPPEVGPGTLVRVLGYRKQLLCLAEALLASAELPGAEPTRLVLRTVRVFAGAG